jgi:hypothetical protein
LPNATKMAVLLSVIIIEVAILQDKVQCALCHGYFFLFLLIEQTGRDRYWFSEGVLI